MLRIGSIGNRTSGACATFSNAPGTLCALTQAIDVMTRRRDGLRPSDHCKDDTEVVPPLLGWHRTAIAHRLYRLVLGDWANQHQRLPPFNLGAVYQLPARDHVRFSAPIPAAISPIPLSIGPPWCDCRDHGCFRSME